jgi:site-specific recombinase XerC
VASTTRRKPSVMWESAAVGINFGVHGRGDRGDLAPLHDRRIALREPANESSLRGGSSMDGYNIAIQDSRMTFAFFVESKFIPEHVEHKTLAGRTHYRSILKHLLRPETVNCMFRAANPANPKLTSVPDWPYLDQVRLCDLKPDHIRSLVSFAIARGYSSQTVKHIRNVTHAIISHAQREGCFTGNNPVSLIKLPPMIRKTERNLTIGQIKAILSLMQYPDKEIALMTITTGMNIVEICELQWKHVNLTDRFSYMDGELIPERSIAVRTRWNRAGLQDMHRGRNRDIEIPEPLFLVLEELQRRKTITHPDDFVLVSESGLSLVATSFRTSRLKPVGRKLGMPWLSWQALRRGYAASLSEFRSQFNHEMAHAAGKEYQSGSARARHSSARKASQATFAMEGRSLFRQSAGRW